MDENTESPEVIAERLDNAAKSTIYVDDSDRTAAGYALGLEGRDQLKKYQHQIERLVEWARMKGAKDTADITWQIKQLANRVGGPTIGNNWAQHLSQYAYLEMERMRLDQELQNYNVPKTTNPTTG